MAVTDTELGSLASELGAALKARGWQVACAESCTGGWIAKILTDLPGSSGWFGWGYVVYANEAKVGALGIEPELLEEHGVVSEPVVRAMAEGIKRISGAEIAVAVSGIAGPDGGTKERPVGTVWFAWTGPAGTRAQVHRFEGERDTIRHDSVAWALRGLLALLAAS
jgi:nicotinamide-nucleotide amidase